MRKIIKYLLVVVLALSNITTVFATPYTNGIASKYGGFNYAPDIYQPTAVLNLELETPQDIFITENDDIYVLEESKLWLLSENSSEENSEAVKLLLDAEDLSKATGIFVQDGKIYIADKGASQVKIFTTDGELLTTIDKPDDTAFGSKSVYAPMKIAVNENGQIFVLSEGNTNGLIQFTEAGEFVGYFGGNNAVTNFFQKLKEKILSDTELGKLIKVTPPSINNFDIDNKSVIYTTTIGNVEKPVKKLNIVGKDIFANDLTGEFVNSVVDIAVNDNFIYMLDQNYGTIVITTTEGDEIALFGSKTANIPINGLFVNPVAIEVDSNNKVYVIDKTLNNVQVFSPTEYTENILNALVLYKNGKYDEVNDIWSKVLQETPNNMTASKSMGLIERKYGNYDNSLSYSKRAYDKESYSDTLWEVRQEAINKYLIYVFALIIGIALINFILNKTFRKSKSYETYENKKADFNKVPFVNSMSLYKRVLSKPNDVFYNMKVKHNVTLLNATIILLLSFLTIFVSKHITAFLFYDGYKELISNPEIIITSVSFFVLYIIANFLITSILDGEGTFKEIYIATIYSFAPYILCTLIAALLTNVLTINEVFFIQLLGMIGIVGTVVLIIIKNIEIHNYNFSESVKVLLLTIVTMVILLIVTISLYTLFNQMIIFVVSMIKEVLARG